MDNYISKTMKERGIKPTSFARTIGIPSSTMFSIYRNQVDIGRISVENFLKIAHGLGMTAEELYYGKPPERHFIDPRQGQLNNYYEQLNEKGRGVLVEVAKSVARDTENRMVKGGGENLDDTGVSAVG